MVVRQRQKEKTTLETLPLEIKHQIFSHFLLGHNVKYTTDGYYPGHKYKFETAIMRTNKKLNEEAAAYLLSHNEFALISVKFFAFEIDRRRFLPIVATEQAARTFKRSMCISIHLIETNTKSTRGIRTGILVSKHMLIVSLIPGPSIEITVKHLDTKCSCCRNGKHQAHDNVRTALLLMQDLDRLAHQLQTVYHTWPTRPILVQPVLGGVTDHFLAVENDTYTYIVWKINEGRSDLSLRQRRDRQTRLLAPLDILKSRGLTKVILGVEDDIASKVSKNTMPRIVWLDAVGFNLLDDMQSQKRYLDNLTNEYPSQFGHLSDSYIELAHLGSNMWIPDMGYSRWESGRSFVMKEVMWRTRFHPLALTAPPSSQAEIDERASSWQYGVMVTVLDCLFTAARLAMLHEPSDTGLFCTIIRHTKAILQCPALSETFTPGQNRMFLHYHLWFTVLSKKTRLVTGEINSRKRYSRALKEFDEAVTAITRGRSAGQAPDIHDDELLEDVHFMRQVVEGKAIPSEEMRSNCRGILRGKLARSSSLSLNRPPGISGWELKEPLKREVINRITRAADIEVADLKSMH